MVEARINCPVDTVVVFDLDDTLYDEADFVLSGIDAILPMLEGIERLDMHECRRLMYEAVERHQNHYSALENYLTRLGVRKQVDMGCIVSALRNHHPVNLMLRPGIRHTLDWLYNCGVTLGLLTDGRSVTQRHKIEALGIAHYFDPAAIRISGETGKDKSDASAYLWFMQRYPARQYIYIGDNPAKDFIYPNRMGWLTICIADRGHNIHPQQGIGSEEAQARLTIEKVCDLGECIYKNATTTEK